MLVLVVEKPGKPGKVLEFAQSDASRCIKAMFNPNKLTVSRSTFLANQAIGGSGGGPARGGAIDTTDGSTAAIIGSAFVGNWAIAADGGAGNGFGRGGGVYNNAGALSVENSTFVGNLARGGSNTTRGGPLVGPAAGGGIFNADSATLLLTGSTFTGNQAVGAAGAAGTRGAVASGGAVDALGSVNLTITHSTFRGNQAQGGAGGAGANGWTGFGGALSLTGNVFGAVTATIRQSTLHGNQAVGGAAGSGGRGGFAISGGMEITGPATVTITDCTVTENRAVGAASGAWYVSSSDAPAETATLALCTTCPRESVISTSSGNPPGKGCQSALRVIMPRCAVSPGR